MSMLAGPRRKQKVINLRAKNNDWSNDSNKFGQRMLEKMGWSSGKGLGANENGIVQHVIAKYKNDERGLGFEDKNDQWTKHEDDFNSLLANLSNGSNSEVQLHSGKSLEDKSKKSKARIHYHKFTRGKDLTRYSEKDLANIFGKKTFKGEKKVPIEEVKEDIKTTEQVFTEKGSMEDYFKNKLAAIKTKSIPCLNKNEDSCNDDTEFAFKGFAAANSDNDTDNDHKEFGFQAFSFYNTNENETTVESNEITKKKKKKKKVKHIETESKIYNDETNDEINGKVLPQEEETETIKQKKSKKKKILEDSLPEAQNDDSPRKKKSKKQLENPEIAMPIADSYNDDTEFTFKGFAAANSDNDTDDNHKGIGFQAFSFYNTNENETTVESNETMKKSNKKKKVKHIETESKIYNEETNDKINSNVLPQEDEPETIKQKKSKKKKILEDSLPEVQNEEPPRKKKSKKQLENPEIAMSIQDLPDDDNASKKKKKRKKKDK